VNPIVIEAALRRLEKTGNRRPKYLFQVRHGVSRKQAVELIRVFGLPGYQDDGVLGFSVPRWLGVLFWTAAT
jgi:hypothetical protein